MIPMNEPIIKEDELADETGAKELKPERKHSRFGLFQNNNFMAFLMNLLAVVIGIALTFGITYLVEHIQEYRKNQEVLQLVKEDLQSSIDSFEPIIWEFQLDSAVFSCVYNYRNRYDQMPSDTIMLFVQTWLRDINLMSENTIADVVKNSRIFEKMNDKHFIVQILTGQLYTAMAVSTAQDIYRERDDIMETLYQKDIFPWKDALTPETARSYFDFLIAQPAIFNNVMGPTIRIKLDVIKTSISNVKKSIALLEERGY